MSQLVETLKSRFAEVIDSEAAIRAITGEPHQRALDKVVTVVDAFAARFIAASPFVLLSTSGPDGIDISPKGDPAGFVQVLDERTLAVPDRPGNQRHDTFRNLLRNPEIGLIFLVPGVSWTLRVIGKAIIVRDEALRTRFAVNGRLPAHVLVVGVERVLAHCPKCMVRSGFWRPEAWPDAGQVPTLAETLIAHAGLAESVESVEAALDAGTRDRLY